MTTLQQYWPHYRRQIQGSDKWMQNVEILFEHMRDFHQWPIEHIRSSQVEQARDVVPQELGHAHKDDIRRDAKAVSLRKALNALRYVTNPEEVKS